MARTETIEWYDEHGELERSIEVELPDPEPTADERLQQMEERLASAIEAIDVVRTASSFEAAKQALSDRMADDTVKGAGR